MKSTISLLGALIIAIITISAAATDEMVCPKWAIVAPQYGCTESQAAAKCPCLTLVRHLRTVNKSAANDPSTVSTLRHGRAREMWVRFGRHARMFAFSPERMLVLC